MTLPRSDVLRSFGAGEDAIPELLEYCTSPFRFGKGTAPPVLPLPDEPGTRVWRSYEERAREEGAAKVLRGALVQLSFPVEEGMSEDEEYRAATRRGAVPFFLSGATGVEFVDPLGLDIRVHDSPAGGVPVVIAEERRDFELLVQALSKKNEPWPVPPSMGALTVAGLVNWDRVERLREEFQANNPEGDWNARLMELAREPELVRDRFILLSRGPYSGVDAAELGQDREEWMEKSVRLRAEHEATHYFTRRVYGCMRNNALDEVLADYMGTVEAFGSYRADAALRFLGLEDPEIYREGGRLQNYMDPPLSGKGFEVLCRIVRRVVENLEAFDSRLEEKHRKVKERTRTLMALTGFHLEGLAVEGAPKTMRKARRMMKI